MNQAEPHSAEAEQGVLGSMLISPHDVIPECVSKISEQHFFVPAHRTIYNGIVNLWNAGKPVDLITFTQELRDRGSLESVGGAGFVTSLSIFVPTAANVQYYIDIVREKRALREVQAAAKECLKRIHQPMLDVAGTLSFAATRFAAIERNSKNGSVDSVAEKNWGAAVNESVVTALELHDLELAPRRKLLGDWFCEGDLGFIFAFRGIGKTWLALGIAQALSTGGNLGAWQAHQAVKVLYVDGEMPPDLIRDRCEGLNADKGAKLEFLNHEILFERTGKVLNITKAEVQKAITDHCSNAGVKVLVLDNLSTLASGMRENEADSWELVNDWLLDLRRRKVAVVIVHHAGRSGEMRGTSKREDNVFWIIALDDAKANADDKRGARFISRFTKPSRNTQEEVPAFEWHFITEANGEVSISHKLAQTMDVFLGLIGDGVNDCAGIAEEMKISKASVSRIAKKAEVGGKLIIRSRRYFLAEGAKSDPTKK
jgi:hypothetical protein